MKLKSTIISLVCIAIVAVSGIMVYIYWPAITGTVNNNQYLTPEQGQAKYDQGYADGNKSEEEQLAQIAYYKKLVDEYYVQVGLLNNEISELQLITANNTNTINELKSQKFNLESQVANLETVKTENENTIKSLNTQIAMLQGQVDTIPGLNTQISSLQALVSQLQTTNELNNRTINDLNTQIFNLNKQIQDMNNLSQNASLQISKLQASVNYYESYIANLENSEQAVATYEIDGSVWKIEIVNKGNEITLTKPANTNTCIINGWTVNGEPVGDTYTLNQNTKFVADVTRKYQVQFMNGDQIYDTQYIVENGTAVTPEPPSKDGYEFRGWLNGGYVRKNIDTIVVTENMIYSAEYLKIHTITFMVDDEVVDTQYVTNGTCVNDVNVETNGTFKGWKRVNSSNIIENLSNYHFTSDTILVADISYDDWVAVNIHNINGARVWTDGVNFYNESNRLLEHSKIYDVDTYTPCGASPFNINLENVANYIWTDGVNYYYSNGNLQYVLDVATHTWNEMTWNGEIIKLNRNNIWTDGINHYYSSGLNQFVLDVATHTWSKMNWNYNGMLNGGNIWTDGVNYFHAGMQLDIATHTWSKVSINNYPDSFSVMDIWTDGVNTYHSRNDKHYVWNAETYTWSEITFTGAPTNFSACYVWTDGVDIYYSNGAQHGYVLVKRTTSEAA